MSINERDNMNVKELEKAYLATPEYQRVMVAQQIAQLFVAKAGVAKDLESKVNELAFTTPEYKAWVEALMVDDKQKREAKARRKEQAEAIQDVWDKEEFAKDQEKIAATEKAQIERRDGAAMKTLRLTRANADLERENEIERANTSRNKAYKEAKAAWEKATGRRIW